MLVQLAQRGQLHTFLGCDPGTIARLEIALGRTYHLHLTKDRVILHQHDEERLRRKQGRRRWQRLSRLKCTAPPVILHRTSPSTRTGYSKVR